MCFPVVTGIPLPQATAKETTDQWLEEPKQKPQPDLLKIAREVCQQF